MHFIGFQHNCTSRGRRSGLKSPSVVNRALLVDRFLRDRGHRLFVYSPRDVRKDTSSVPGYVIDEDRFRPTRAAVPQVNGNWTHGTRRLLNGSMGYDEFGRWADERRVGIYVPHAFSELIRNKYETYRLVRSYREDLHPHCEPYRHSVSQLDEFTSSGRLTFVKPRAGSKGNRIAALSRDARGMALSWHRNGRRNKCRLRSLAEVRDRLAEFTAGSRRYVIQRGIDTVPIDRSVFDIRVIMVHDGEQWTWIHEARIGRGDSRLSNVSQGGRSRVTEDVLLDVLGYEGAGQALNRLYDESFGLAKFLERLHPGDIMEVAFDFVIDTGGELRLIEINTKPGLASSGFLRRLGDLRAGDTERFRRWVYPHVESLASFLAHKYRQNAA